MTVTMTTSDAEPRPGTELTVTEARATLPALLDRVAAGEEITITRHGVPAAVLLRPDRVKTRRAAVDAALTRAREIGRMIEESRGKPLGPPVMSAERAEELVAQIRADRDSGR